MSQSSFFAELAEVTKPAPSLRLVIEGVGALLGIGPQPMPTKHRVPPNSRYTPTVTLLAQDPDATLERLVSLDFSIVSNRAADALYGVVRHKSWSAADAAAQGAHLGELAELLVRVDAELAMTPGRKPVAATRVAVALDGSRMSHTAFAVACHLRGQGTLSIVHVDDPSKDYLPSHMTAQFISIEAETRCVTAAIPSSHYAIDVVQKTEGSASTRDLVLRHAEQAEADILVLGSFGRKGPSIFAVGSVTDWSVRSSPLTTVVVKTTTTLPECTVDGAATRYAPATFVCAVDGSRNAHAACEAALSLMKPQDELQVLHIAAEATDADGSARALRQRVVEEYGGILRKSQVEGTVSVVQRVAGQTIAQQVCEFTEDRKANYLVIGVDGMGAFLKAKASGAPLLGSNSDQIVRASRCTTIICKVAADTDTPRT